jgi:Fis family transcriptional regulator, factor for inversion stimulation protein
MIGYCPMTQKIKNVPLSSQVIQALEEYFTHLGDSKPSQLYDLVIAEVEKPLIDFVLRHTKNNKSEAAEILGITRGTLYKKIDIYKL